MNNKVYTISDELLNEDIYSTIRSDLQKYWTPPSSKKQQSQEPAELQRGIKPNIQITLNTNKLSSAYKDIRKILFTYFFKNGPYKTQQILRNNIFNEIDKTIFKANILGHQIFIKLNEQQKPKFVPRVTFDISSILKNQNLDKEQNDEIMKILSSWVDDIAKKYSSEKQPLQPRQFSTMQANIASIDSGTKASADERNLSNSYNRILQSVDRHLDNLTLSGVSGQNLTTIKNYIKKLFTDTQTISPNMNIVMKEYNIAPRTSIIIDASGLITQFNLSVHDKQLLFDKIKAMINDINTSIKSTIKFKLVTQQVSESKDISPIHINFTKSKQLNESFLVMFGTAIKMILQRMFGQDVYVPPMTITGNKQQMETFISALAGEKRYFDSYIRYGLNDPRTYQDRYKLQAAVNDFERNTGIKWPFK